MKCSIIEIKQIIETLSFVFDNVRIVDPVAGNVITLNENEEINFEEYFCYKVWLKEKRCKNCISLKALENNQRLTKYEFVNQDIYHIVSKPFELILKDNTSLKLTIEIVSKITKEVLFDAYGNNEFFERIVSFEKKLYQDSLTEAFTRRYFDEKVFCQNGNGTLISSEVIFIMIDLLKFKSINDKYGHDMGDWVLKNTVKAIKNCIRADDAVVRIGGDEFLIILKNCDLSVAKRIISSIKKEMVVSVVYDKESNKSAIANFGIAYTKHFEPSEEYISPLLSEADKNMYLDKEKYK